jgi:hypothetical protein
VAFQRSEHKSASCFTVGERVTHISYGEGTVLDIFAKQGADRIKIRFEECGDKWILLSFGYVFPCSDNLTVQNQIAPVTENECRSLALISDSVQYRNRRVLQAFEQVEESGELASSPTLNRRRALKFFIGLFAAAPIAAKASAAKQGRELSILQTRIAGFAHYKGHQCLPHMQVGQKIILRREPTNRHDRKAIEVYWQGNKIGYVPRISNVALSQLMDQRESITARLTEIYHRNWEPLGFEVTVRV